MTFYAFIVPLGALAFAGAGILFIRREERKLDAKLRADAGRAR
ncbi:hypothetical protein LX81_02332 [Palleronia aestuarii]|uniref:Heme exporter protein D n=1 Tax=Palleronia aestuarii TaxID=568105 RepID=A0A2W7N7L9_9RHOB|nr:hypothetical protein [Palleronia aestuarii]PZX16058.1 hypothetical protein LX81_02332 [Palleronia aestuarii]